MLVVASGLCLYIIYLRCLNAAKGIVWIARVGIGARQSVPFDFILSIIVLVSFIENAQSRPLSQHSNNGEDGQQLGTTKVVVGAKVSQLTHLFQNRSKEEVSTTAVPLSPTAASVPVAATAPAIVVSGRSETDKETAHQDVMPSPKLNFFFFFLKL